MVHTYEYVKTLAERHDEAKLPPRWREDELRGEVEGLESLVAYYRGEADATSSVHVKAAQAGESAVDKWAEMTFVYARSNMATESLLRAEGMLACARRRLDTFLTQQRASA